MDRLIATLPVNGAARRWPQPGMDVGALAQQGQGFEFIGVDDGDEWMKSHADEVFSHLATRGTSDSRALAQLIDENAKREAYEREQEALDRAQWREMKGRLFWVAVALFCSICAVAGLRLALPAFLSATHPTATNGGSSAPLNP